MKDNGSPNTNELRVRRRAHGLKAIDVADILGFTPEHISRVENGTRRLSRSAWRVLEFEYPPEPVMNEHPSPIGEV